MSTDDPVSFEERQKIAFINDYAALCTKHGFMVSLEEIPGTERVNELGLDEIQVAFTCVRIAHPDTIRIMTDQLMLQEIVDDDYDPAEG